MGGRDSRISEPGASSWQRSGRRRRGGDEKLAAGGGSDLFFFRSVIERQCRDGLSVTFRVRGPSRVELSAVSMVRKSAGELRVGGREPG